MHMRHTMLCLQLMTLVALIRGKSNSDKYLFSVVNDFGVKIQQEVCLLH